MILVGERLGQENCLEFAASLDSIENYRLLGDHVSEKGKEKTSPERVKK